MTASELVTAIEQSFKALENSYKSIEAVRENHEVFCEWVSQNAVDRGGRDNLQYLLRDSARLRLTTKKILRELLETVDDGTLV